MFQFIIQACLIGLGFAATAPVQASVLHIYNWPYSFANSNSASFPAKDPFLGTMVCPALTRLNLMNQKSEPSLLHKVEVVPSQDAKLTTWKLTWTPDLKWWSGERVKGEEMQQFVEKALQAYPLKHFQIQATQQELSIHWSKPPPIGPYFLNQHPFQRIKDQKRECAGDYREGESPLEYVHVDGKDPQTIRFHAPDEERLEPFLEFQFASDYSAPTSKQLSRAVMDCSRPIDLPFYSVVIWNLLSERGKEPSFRMAMTHASPRGALLRQGAGGLGSLVSAPIIRAHPGYHRSMLVRPFDMAMAENLLNRIGYVRPHAERFFKDARGEHLKVSLASPAPTSLIAQVLKDAYHRLGIELTYLSDQRRFEADGILTTMTVPWPETSLLKLLQHYFPEKTPFLSGNLELLLSYDKSLTFEVPDFELLKKIHKKIYDQELMTLLLQHRVCLKEQGLRDLPKILIRNPDWFKSIILNNFAHSATQ